MEPVRWGVLGASHFALTKMAPAIHEASGADLVALATARPEGAAAMRAYQPRLRVHPTYDALLADPGIDAVYVPLPNHLHVEWTLKALEAGKHVLTEKPLAMKAAEFDAVIAARDRTGLLAAEAFMIVHHPQFIKARDLVASGAIGRVEHVDVAFTYDNRTDPANIRNRPETGGGGLPDIGVYAFGSARFVTGAEPAALRARIRWENGVDTYAQVEGTMEGPQGAFTYQAMVSMRLFPRQTVTVHGETGLIRLTAPFNAGVYDQAEMELHRMGFETTTFRWPDARHYKLQVEAFGRSVREGVPYACPLEFSRGTQAMMDRVFAVAMDP